MRHGSQIDPPNRFEKLQHVRDLEQVADDEDYLRSIDNRPIDYIFDQTESIVSKNNSPDLPFNYSLNPYRGCIHACAYCYARPTHEYLGFNAGLDFETKIFVKTDAAKLFKKFLSRRSWQVEPIVFSGVTDCYQPAERKFRLTRSCLEVADRYSQPLSIVTKNALVLRDLDILVSMAKRNLVRVYVSVTTLDAKLARNMEPRTSIPSARLRAIETLSIQGIPVGVMLAPIIPGLNDSEMPAILEAASTAGAITAGYVLLRLPLSVETVFEEWIFRNYPDKAELVLGRIKQTRNSKINSSQWGVRMRGEGQIAEQISGMFKIFKKKFSLDQAIPGHNCNDFERPTCDDKQLRLF